MKPSSIAKIFFAITYIAIPRILQAQDLSSLSNAEKKVSVTGNVSIHSIVYNASGIENRRQPLSYFFNGDVNFRFYGIQLPFSFTLSEQERNFSQPFNQFGISPKYKWLTIHGGYRNIVFSPYTLGGATILGYGAEINPGKLRLGIMYGRLNRATEIDSSTGYVRPYSFARKGIAVKWGLGSNRTFIDFSALKAWDDSTSVKNKLISSDSLSVAPASNITGAVKISIGLGKHFRLFGDAGYSLFTNNVNSTITLPNDLKQIADLLKPYITINATTERFLAYNAGIEFESSLLSFKTTYQHVDPDFKSMGAYYFNTDVENITIAPSFRTPNNKFRFNGSIGFQHDNVLKTRESTTKRLIGNSNLSWNPNYHFGIDVNYSNYSTNSTPQVVNINNRYILSVSNNTLSVTPRYLINGKNISHLFMLNYNQSGMKDFNSTNNASNHIVTTIAFINYNINFLIKHLTIGTTISHSNTILPNGSAQYSSLALNFNKSTPNNQLALMLNGAYSLSNNDNTPNLLNSNCSLTYRPHPKHQFYLRANFIQSISKPASPVKGYKETTGEIAYTLLF